MLFKSKKTLPVLKLYAKEQLIYDGLLRDVPLTESVILEKSTAFFDDPEPCQIHRSAVRTRLTAEIQQEFTECGVPDADNAFCCAPGPLLLSYADFPSIDRAVLKL